MSTLRKAGLFLTLICGAAACDSSGVVAVKCGDGTCDPSEHCASCPEDCTCPTGQRCSPALNACTDLCGDGRCVAEDGETCDTCAKDCGCLATQACVSGACRPLCGDGSCDATIGETCTTCDADCGCLSGLQECHEGACRLRCGNGTCDVERGEGCGTCADDCACSGPGKVCLENTCRSTCGNGTCDTGLGETCVTCDDDCACTTGTCNTQTASCETPDTCDPNADCELTFTHSADLLVNTGTVDTVHAAVTSDPDGRVFVGYGEGSNFPVRRLNGGSLVTAGNVASDAYFHGARHLVATGSNALVALFETTTGGTHTKVARSTDGGATWSAGVQLDKAGVTDNGFGTSIVAANGKLYAAYVGFVTGCVQSSCYEPYFTTSTDNGATWANPRRLGNDTIQDDYTAVAVDGTVVVVAWNSFDGDVLVARSADGGTTFAAPVRVNDVVGKAHAAQPGFIAVRGQRVHVVWSDTRTDSEGDIYMDTSLDGGATWGADAEVHADKRRWQEQPTVRVAADGRAWVLWQDLRNNNYDVYVAATKDGKCFCRSVRFNRNDTGSQSNARLWIDAAGTLHSAWRDTTATPTILYNSASPK